MALGALEGKFWKSFKKLLSISDSSESGFDGRAVSKQMIRKVGKLIRQRSLSDWVQLSRYADICLSPVLTLRQVLLDCHLKARRVFWKKKEKDGRQMVFVRSPLLMDGQRMGSSKRAPKLGEHNRIILRQLGYDAADIQRLRATGVIS